MVRFFAGACSFLLLFGCGPRKSEAPTSDSIFNSFADEYFKSYFSFYPTQGSTAGFHEFDAKLENFASTRVHDRVVEIRSLLAKLRTITDGTLSRDNSIDSMILDGQLRSEIQDLDVLRTWQKNPLPYLSVAGDAIDQLMKRKFAPEADRLRLITVRLQQMSTLLRGVRDNIKTPPPEFTYLATRIVHGSIEYFRDIVPSWAKTATSDAGLLANFQAANGSVLADLQMLDKFIQTDLKTRSTGNFAIGAEAFSNKLRYEEMIDLPLDKLLAIGEANLRKDHDAFVETAERIAHGRSPAEAMKSLSSDHPDEKQLLPSARSTLEKIRQFLIDKKIVTFPSEVRPQVAETPPFLRSGVFAAMDSPGAYETKTTEAFYYVTPTESDWTPQHKEEHLRLFNRPVMDIMSIHEVYPGHFTQFLYSPNFPTKTRRLVSASSNAEGWAHYSEQMMVEEGFGGGDPKIRLAQLSEALLRDCRYVVGIKLHTQGMTVEQGADVFVQQGFQERANALEESRRGAYDPTYLYYTAGKLQIYKLREDYRQKQGANYSLGKFHDTFVGQGAIPIALVRRVLLGENSGPTL